MGAFGGGEMAHSEALSFPKHIQNIPSGMAAIPDLLYSVESGQVTSKSNYFGKFLHFCCQKGGIQNFKGLFVRGSVMSHLWGFHHPYVKEMVRLHYVLRGIRLIQGNAHMRPTWTPVITQMLAHLLNLIKVNIHNAHDQAMFAAATLLAFFGMLRISEYTTPSPRCFDPHAHLSINDISFNFRRRMLSVRIKASKTDPFRQGMTLRIAFNFLPLCPGLAMLRYFRSRTGTDGPLFIFAVAIF